MQHLRGQVLLGRAPYSAPPDLFDTARDQAFNSSSIEGILEQGTSAPAFPPFKFDVKRTRIDWRVLHGVDINQLVRDVDLDTLERVVSIIANGDLDAEDSRQLSELSFSKVFRLAQLTVEYLLYVQECLTARSEWLLKDRAALDKFAGAARVRIRELDTALKMSRREMRRARKTIKTYELMAAMNGGRLGDGGHALQPTAIHSEGPSAAAVAMEAILRKDLSLLSDRLSRALQECSTLRGERDEIYGQLRELDSITRTRTGALFPFGAAGSGAGTPGGVSPRMGRDGDATAAKTMQMELNRALAELRRLRTDKEEAAIEIERLGAEKRRLQADKEQLLLNMCARNRVSGDGSSLLPEAGSSGNLAVLLIDSERQKRVLEADLRQAKQAASEAGRELMRLMRDSAKPPQGLASALPSGDLDVQRQLREVDLQRQDLALRCSELERDAADAAAAAAQARAEAALAVADARDAQQRSEALMRELGGQRREASEQLRAVQEELEVFQAATAEAQRQLALARGPGPLGSTATANVKPKAGGLVRVVDDNAAVVTAEESTGMLQGRVSELEAVNDCLNEQVAALREQCKQLTMQPQHTGGPLPGQGWAVQELERLRAEAEQAKHRNAELTEAVTDRDDAIERLRQTIRDLQLQVQLAGEAPAADPALGRVKQQVQEIERLGSSADLLQVVGPTPQAITPPQSQPSILIKPDSFNFRTEAAGASTTTASTAARDETLPDTPSVRGSMSSLQSSLQQTAQPRPQLQPWQLFQGPALLARPRDQLEAERLRAETMRRVAGQSDVDLANLLEKEIRAVSNEPFEFEEDDQDAFRAELPHELVGRAGVLSKAPHDLQDLTLARANLRAPLMSALNNQVASLGLDPTTERLTDREYAAAMLELEDRRNALLSALPKPLQARAVRLRDALFTHLELIKRQEVATSSPSLGAPVSAPPATLMASAAPSASVSQQQQQQQQQALMQVPAQSYAAVVSGASGSTKVSNVLQPPQSSQQAHGTLATAAVTSGAAVPQPVVAPPTTVIGSNDKSNLSNSLHAMLPPSQLAGLSARTLPTSMVAPVAGSSMLQQPQQLSLEHQPSAAQQEPSLARMSSVDTNSQSLSLDRPPNQRQPLGHAPQSPAQSQVLSSPAPSITSPTSAISSPSLGVVTLGSPPPSAMNTSIRSVRDYRASATHSDFDDDESDEGYGPRKTGLRNLREEIDEYAITEDEEDLKDEGLDEGLDEDLSAYSSHLPTSSSSHLNRSGGAVSRPTTAGGGNISSGSGGGRPATQTSPLSMSGPGPSRLGPARGGTLSGAPDRESPPTSSAVGGASAGRAGGWAGESLGRRPDPAGAATASSSSRPMSQAGSASEVFNESVRSFGAGSTVGGPGSGQVGPAVSSVGGGAWGGGFNSSVRRSPNATINKTQQQLNNSSRWNESIQPMSEGVTTLHSSDDSDDAPPRRTLKTTNASGVTGSGISGGGAKPWAGSGVVQQGQTRQQQAKYGRGRVDIMDDFSDSELD